MVTASSAGPLTADTPPLAAVLGLALLQGLLLYGLHQAVAQARWPATHAVVLFPLGLLALGLPVSLQLLSRHWRAARVWGVHAVFALVLVIIGAYLGVQGGLPPLVEPHNATPLLGTAVPLVALGFIVLAFVRASLEAGVWRPGYPALFAAAWRTALTLAEAGLFMGLLALLLVLWAALFQTLQIPLFSRLFQQPLFGYPAAALAFGVAVHLVGSVERLVDVVLGQVLGLLKWLAPVAGLLVVLFTVALLPRLPGLLVSGDRALNAAWLLWLVMVTVLLINAAYQDGRVAQPYGRVLGAALRALPPLLVIVSGTALYALCVRVGEHGLTVGRYWGLVTAGCALLYAVSYSWAAVRPGPWMRGVSTANPLLALLLAGVLLLSLTPVLSPFRLSAQSQQARVLNTADIDQQRSALRYLQSETGHYGRDAVQALPAAQVQALSAPLSANATDWLAGLRVVPAGRDLPEALREVLRQAHEAADSTSRLQTPMAFWIQPTESDVPELLLLLPGGRYARYAQREGEWARID